MPLRYATVSFPAVGSIALLSAMALAGVMQHHPIISLVVALLLLVPCGLTSTLVRLMARA